MSQSHDPRQGMSRRHFLRLSAASAGVLALAACAAPVAAPGGAPAEGEPAAQPDHLLLHPGRQ
ncbi:MAG: twin-arginine translocation signal domain-containing protein [Caldilineaceae bacterium]